MPALDKLNKAMAVTDFVMLAVSVDEGGVEAVAPSMLSNRLSLPVLFDPGGSVAGLYGTFKFPETYIVDRDGVVRYKVIGSRDWADPANMQSMRDLSGPNKRVGGYHVGRGDNIHNSGAHGARGHQAEQGHRLGLRRRSRSLL